MLITKVSPIIVPIYAYRENLTNNDSYTLLIMKISSLMVPILLIMSYE